MWLVSMILALTEMWLVSMILALTSWQLSSSLKLVYVY
jgi:hypothetical protein